MYQILHEEAFIFCVHFKATNKHSLAHFIADALNDIIRAKLYGMTNTDLGPWV